MNRRLLLPLGCGLLVLAHAAPIVAQDLPVLDPGHARLILQEVSGDAAYGHIRYMSQFHRPRGGSDNLWRVAAYYEQKAREFGLAQVQLIRQAYGNAPWNPKFADLWIVEPEPERLASTLQSPLHLADNSRAADVTAALVDVGAGADSAFAGVDVSGKVVLTHGSVGGVLRRAVERGALGIIWFPDPAGQESFSYPDQLEWISVPVRGSEGYEPTFAFGLSLRQGMILRERLARAEKPFVVHALVQAAFDSEHGAEPWQVMTEAVIPGSEPEIGQDIVLTAHLQEEATSANDDASGCASIAEIARALSRLIADGRLPRPRRTIRFWWANEISSERQYFADNPEAHRRIWVNVNQDMVGADQSQDVMRVQNITRLPAARFHFFNDVVESVIDYMVASNNSELAQLQAGGSFYPAPHIAHLGSHERYNAKMIFFHNNTDHMTFTETPIGVPGVTFTNWPDNYIHSSDDDLWNIDRTQLGRNAAAVALIAYAMAGADSAAARTLAAVTVGRGAERLARNLRLGLTWIATATDKAAAYHEAGDQIRYAAERERIALGSLAQIHPSARSLVQPLLQELARREAQAAREIEIAYRQATGRGGAPPRAPTPAEERLAALRPAVTGGPKEFQSGRGAIEGVSGLHSLMAFEVLNAVDGRRSGLDIYRFVAAEAREAGRHYYGTVTPDAVLAYLQSVAAAGLIRLD
jgi:hypothetical protein